jgi:predicted TIM-barrel fold metal-dependent hydrolase
LESPVSAVSYVLEPPDLWTGKSLTGAPAWHSGPEPGWVVGDFTCPVPAWQVHAVLPAAQRGGDVVDLATLPGEIFTPAGRLAAQDGAGVSAEVLYPTPQLWGALGLLPLDPDVEAACVRVYNDWLARFVGHSPDRFVGVAAIPCLGGVDRAVAELRRAAGLGLKGAVLRAFPTSGERAIKAGDDAFWASLVELDIVLSFDSSFGPSTGAQISGPRGVGTATALTSFVYEGVVERFPAMKIVLAAPTAGWVPHWLEQADDLYMRRPGTHNPELTRALPSDYLRRRPFFTFAGDDVILRHPDAYVSSEHLMWCNQFPTYHSVEAMEGLGSLSSLPAARVERVSSTTCRGLYGLRGGAPIDLEPSLEPLVHAIPT